MSRRQAVPLIRLATWISGNRVRLWFSTGRVSVVALPVRSAKKAHTVFDGIGLDIGNGVEMSPTTLHDWPDSEIVDDPCSRKSTYKKRSS